MPFQSEEQRKAMAAAAGGHSTLGIPKSVGEKFIAHAKDMAPEDWNELLTGLRKFLDEEAAEPEHRSVDIAGIRDLLTKFFSEEAAEPEHAEDIGDVLSCDVDFSESEHNRDDDGKFSATSGGQRHAPVWGKNKKTNAEQAAKVAASLGHNARVYENPKDKTGAAYFSQGQIHINASHPLWKAPVETMKKQNGFLSSDHPEHAIHHEIGHALYDPPSNFMSLSDQNTAREVSKYAARNPKEFVSEVHAGMQAGKTYPEKTMAMFKRYATPRKSGANDGCAFDKASVRSFDENGHMTVAKAHISKAMVCPYYGHEIPDFEKLGLDPNKVYKLFRDPDELAKAAPSFNNVQILLRHVPVNADDPQRDVWVGNTGTDAEFNDPYLDNSLKFHVREGIDAVESGEQQQLSAGYRYRADMAPGTYQGEAYDGVMRDLSANHLAIVQEGRCGADVIVGDSALPNLKDMITMTKTTPTVLSRKAVLTRGALLAHLRPRLAQDAKIDLTPILAPVSAKNFKAQIPTIAAGLVEATKGKLAKDANLNDVTQFLNALEEVDEAEGIDADPNTGLPMMELPKPEAKDAVGNENLRAYLKSVGLEDAEIEEACKLLGATAEAVDAEIPAKIEEKKEEMVSKPAMDAAIKAASDAAAKKATADAIRTQREIRDAEEAVRPYVGTLAMAHDSAEGVYRTTLTSLGAMDEAEAKALPLPALKAVLKAQPVPGARPAQTRIAQDSGAAQSFASRFPGADRIGNV